MAKLFKWIGGYLGLVLGGPLGALAGFVLGSLVDSATSTDELEANNNGSRPGGQNQSYGAYQQYQQRDTFRFALLVLASYIIRADGKVMHSEMQLVRAWLRNNFGPDAQEDGERVLNELFKKQRELGAEEYKSAVMSSCRQLAQIMTYEQRLQLLNFLMMIAKADGSVVIEEERALRECGAAMGISAADVESVLNLHEGGSSLEAAYKVMGVSPDATDAEVKAAYRRMALKNHPDKVAALGEDVRKAAEKKFQEINAAKEVIWKARGMR